MSITRILRRRYHSADNPEAVCADDGKTYWLPSFDRQRVRIIGPDITFAAGTIQRRTFRRVRLGRTELSETIECVGDGKRHDLRLESAEAFRAIVAQYRADHRWREMAP